MRKKVLILGGGVSGLSVGCYALMNGYDAEIHEATESVGGLCTSWRRGDYLFDGAIHWVNGSGPNTQRYDMWLELGALQEQPMFHHDVFARIVSRSGRELSIYTDPDRLEQHLLELAPKDAKPIRQLCGTIKALSDFKFYADKPWPLLSAFDKLKLVAEMVPYLSHFNGFAGMTMARLGAAFSDPLLRSTWGGVAMNSVLFAPEKPAGALILVLAEMSRRSGGVPFGGSMSFTRQLEKRYTGLGGTLVFNSRASKILERNGQAFGVRCEDGQEHTGDWVVSALDLEHTLFSLLDGTRVDPIHKELFATAEAYSPIVRTCFGVKRSFDDDISAVGTSYELERPASINCRQHAFLNLKNYSHDPAMAPKGKAALASFFSSDWDRWATLRADRPAYEAEKQKIADEVASQFERSLPGFTASIEVTDVATPPTYQRYSGNFHGRFTTWVVTPGFRRRYPTVPKTVPGLDKLLLSSAWTNPPGGVTICANGGRLVAQLICAADGRAFTTARPMPARVSP